MDETPYVRPGCVLQVFASFAEQEAEDIRYWNARSIDEKMRRTVEIIEGEVRERGKRGVAAPSDRSLTRLPRPWG